ncbi:MAG: ribosome maturation factor RimM [Deferribacterales bacterium]|jgi:16S rRNA processing protein RimM
MKLVKVGRLINTHGLDGELIMQILTDTPEVFDEIEYMMLAVKGDVKASLAIEYMQEFKGNVLVGLVGVEDIDTAKKYKGMDVVVPEDMLPELEGEIYWHELEGAPVFDKDGETVGTLVDYMEAGGADIFRIKTDKGYYLISDNTDHVLEINVKEKKLVIDRIGLVSEEI